MAAADPPPRRAVLPVGGLPRRRRDRLLRDPVHRAISAVAVRLQRRRPALVLAGALLRLLGPGDPPLSTVRPRGGTRPPPTPRRAPSPTTVPRADLSEVVSGPFP